MHLFQTGNGACFVDSWPNPATLLVSVADNYALLGQPELFRPVDLQNYIAGFVDAPAPFVPQLEQIFVAVQVWPRIVLTLSSEPQYTLRQNFQVRRLAAGDAHYLWGLSTESFWIAKTWGGPAGLAASGYAWGAFAGERVVSVACTFFVGDKYEEIGVVTEPGFRGLGLSGVCAGKLCQDIRRRGRWPSWSTSPDNTPSLRVAQKLGFSKVRRDQLYVIDAAIPAPASA
jgi:predicted GNAT family acetyltransferase